MMYGQQKDINGKWYLFNRKSGKMEYGQQKDVGHWYLFDRNSGNMKYGSIKDVNQKWYYFNTSSGIMTYGWISVSGHFYYYDRNSGVRNNSFYPIYFSQLDSRWYNTAGCVEASLAMILAGFGYGVNPGNLISYANQVGLFGPGGTDGRGLVALLNHYGLSYQNLNSLSDLQSSLKAGYPVLLAVMSPFPEVAGTSASHELVLYGYSNGYTQVFDPWNNVESGTWSISSLFSDISYINGDNDAGSSAKAVW
jgi:hypothetical protein